MVNAFTKSVLGVVIVTGEIMFSEFIFIGKGTGLGGVVMTRYPEPKAKGKTLKNYFPLDFVFGSVEGWNLNEV